mmetsp:Transcript_17813/g.30193  ORF Transcript_17813/g.30193 Transcript_17813/m.30193 type:complete len:99 (-) Transcript_17813:519-815(-)
MTTGSDEAYLRFFESYARSPLDEIQSLPKEPGDFRQRVGRDTIRGRYGVFHDNIETYFYRQWRAFTCPRMAVFVYGSFGLMMHGIFQFRQTFPNIRAY